MLDLKQEVLDDPLCKLDMSVGEQTERDEVAVPLRKRSQAVSTSRPLNYRNWRKPNARCTA